MVICLQIPTVLTRRKNYLSAVERTWDHDVRQTEMHAPMQLVP
jgi:hypothetical protein